MSLSARSISAVFWGAGGSAVRMLLQMLTQVVLARLLGPVEYGVFAIGAIVISFSAFFSDIGMAYGLIQKREVSDRDVRFVFTWQIILGCLISVVVAGFAGPIAGFFGEPRAEDVVRVLSVLCLVNAVTAPALNLLKRALDFKTQQIAFLLSYLLGYVLVGVPMALLGAKVWALVAAWMVQALLMGLLLYRVARHPLRPLLWYEQARRQGLYGVTVLSTNLLNWLISNIDRVLIGRLLPAHNIGLYATAYNLVYNSTSSVLSVLQPVFFSASARLVEQEAGAQLERGFITLVSAIGLFFLPAFAVLATLAPSFVLTLYGPAWADASALLRPLALAMPFFLIWGMCTPVLWASGNASREFLAQWPLAVAWGVLCWYLARHGGAVGVAWGVLGLFVARCAVIVRMALMLTQLRLRDVWLALRGGLALSGVMAGAAWLGASALVDRPAAWQLLVGCLLAAGLFMLALQWLPALIAPELAVLMSKVLDTLPPAWAGRLQFLCGQERVR